MDEFEKEWVRKVGKIFRSKPRIGSKQGMVWLNRAKIENDYCTTSRSCEHIDGGFEENVNISKVDHFEDLFCEGDTHVWQNATTLNVDVAFNIQSAADGEADGDILGHKKVLNAAAHSR